jgi:hypothetical protein
VTSARFWRQPIRHPQVSGASMLCGIETVRRGQNRSIDFDQCAMPPTRDARLIGATSADAARARLSRQP